MNNALKKMFIKMNLKLQIWVLKHVCEKERITPENEQKIDDHFNKKKRWGGHSHLRADANTRITTDLNEKTEIPVELQGSKNHSVGDIVDAFKKHPMYDEEDIEFLRDGIKSSIKIVSKKDDDK